MPWLVNWIAKKTTIHDALEVVKCQRYEKRGEILIHKVAFVCGSLHWDEDKWHRRTRKSLGLGGRIAFQFSSL